jgi:hypothetical protein
MGAEREFGRLDDVVRRSVAETPDPPRSAPLGDLLRASYSSTTGKSLVGLGLLILAFAMFLGLLATDDVGYLVLALPFGGFGVLSLVTPSFPARRAARAVREGIRVPGRVTEIDYRPPGDSTTIDAIKHGFARGRRTVEHPLGAFEEPFETDAGWAGSLRVGSIVQLLVDPQRQRVLLDTGLVSAPRAQTR